VQIVDADALNRAGLAVSHDDGPADQFGSLQFAKDVDGSLFAGPHVRDLRKHRA
jgi:hypothetical protein